jgi:hypothetical protein
MAESTFTDRIFHRVHRTGEEIKNDLPNLIERSIEQEAWKDAVNPATGKPFANAGEWLVARYPLGPGVGHGRFAITYDDCIRLSDDRPKLKDMLVKHRPKSKSGGNGSNQHTKKDSATVDNVNNCLPPAAVRKTGNSRLYIEERLERDHAEIWQAYLRGEYKSARQAGIAAGFVKDTHDPLMRLKANWKKATKKQRKEFILWTQKEETT